MREGEGKIKYFIRQRKNSKVFESPYFNSLKILQISSILFCFVPVALLILEDLVLSNLPFHRFNVAWGLLDNSGFINGSSLGILRHKYWFTFSGFMSNLPYLAKLTMECTVFFHAYFTMWDVNLVPANINFNNFKVMKQMGQVDSIICSKSAFFAQAPIVFQSFQVGKELFVNEKADVYKYTMFGGDDNEISRGYSPDTGYRRMTNGNQQVNQYDDQLSRGDSNGGSTDDEGNEQIEYLPNQIKIDQHFDC